MSFLCLTQKKNIVEQMETLIEFIIDKIESSLNLRFSHNYNAQTTS